MSTGIKKALLEELVEFCALGCVEPGDLLGETFGQRDELRGSDVAVRLFGEH